MGEPVCLNCGTQLAPGQKFCSGCGQSADIKRLTVQEMLFDFSKLFLKGEKGILRLFKGLALNPGRTAAEYVEGKRKKYYNPFFFTAICIGLMILIHSRVKPYDEFTQPDPFVLERITDQKIKELYIHSIDRINTVQQIVNKNLKTITILISPYFAFFLWLFFRRRGRNFSEITIAYVLFTAFITLATSIFFSPLLARFKGEGPYYFILYTSIILQTVYIGWGLKTFFNFKTVAGFLKVFAALCLIGLIGFIFVFVAYFLYVYNGAFTVLQYL